MKEQVAYLGHVITKEGVAVDKSKIEDMLAWPVPTSIKALRGFLGWSGYYRKFVKGYGTIVKPLTTLLQKDKFHWTEDSTKALTYLKEALAHTPILRLPHYTKEFTVESDASNTGIGAVLTQEGKPLAYFSKALGPQRASYVYLWERVDGSWSGLLISWTNIFISKLTGSKLPIWTEGEQFTTAEMDQQTDGVQLHHTILYRKGKENTVAYALSRMFEDESGQAAKGGAIPGTQEDMDAIERGRNISTSREQ